MSGFFESMFAEITARRRRLRAMLGDRGQAIAEFLVLSGLLLGSLGLFTRPWMAGVTPWGFAIPFVFLAGYVLVEARRQRALTQTEDTEAVRRGYDWGVLLWSLACTLLGVAAFVIAFTSAPPSGEEDIWTPPESAVSVDISP